MKRMRRLSEIGRMNRRHVVMNWVNEFELMEGLENGLDQCNCNFVKNEKLS